MTGKNFCVYLKLLFSSKSLKISSIIPLEQSRLFGVTKFVLPPESNKQLTRSNQPDRFIASTLPTINQSLSNYQLKEQRDFDKILEKLAAETRIKSFKSRSDDADLLPSTNSPIEPIQNQGLSLNGRFINNKV